MSWDDALEQMISASPSVARTIDLPPKSGILDFQTPFQF
jgi:hypothetical protein